MRPFILQPVKQERCPSNFPCDSSHRSYRSWDGSTRTRSSRASFRGGSGESIRPQAYYETTPSSARRSRRNIPELGSPLFKISRPILRRAFSTRTGDSSIYSGVTFFVPARLRLPALAVFS